MSRVLLADDSPQALRLGEQILRSQGMEVVSVTDGAVALRRLADVDPDLLIVDVFLPSQNGFDLVRSMRSQVQYRHIPVVFAAGPADKFDEQDAKNAGADLIIRKPFEASSLLQGLQPLIEKSKAARSEKEDKAGGGGIDRHSVRAAVTLALDSAMPMLIDELTERVMLVLTQRR